MKHLLAILLAAAPAGAQVNFDSAGGGLSPLSAAASAVPDSPAPERVQEEGPCEPFSVESSMAAIPVYDQQLEGTPATDTGICYAVVAAHMFDHWALGAGGGGELVSPLLLDAAARARSGRGGQGGELTAETLLSMAREDICTLGVAAGGRRELGVADELALAFRPGAEGAQEAAQGPAGKGKNSLWGRFDELPSRMGEAGCRPLAAGRYNAIYQRTRQVREAGGLRGVPFTVSDLRGFFARNAANQPVAVKFNYEVILGDPARADSATPHWALVIARRQSGDSCEYLVRNSMGRDTPLRWVEESRLAAAVRSMAALVP